MIPAERQSRILAVLRERGIVSVSALASLLEVSEGTIRRDLSILSQEQGVVRSHGGAVYPTGLRSTVFEKGYADRKQQNLEEKERIAALAASRITEGESMILGCGSTVLAVAQQLKSYQSLTIVTHDLQIAISLSNLSNIDLTITSGTVRHNSYTLMGPYAEAMLDDLSVDTTIMGVDAINETGVSTLDIMLVGVMRKCIKAGRRVIVVADHSKFSSPVFARICPLDEIDEIITDKQIDEKYVDYLRKKGPVRITPA